MSIVTYDAGQIGCGELIMRLRQRFREMAAGSQLELIAHDPGAVEDIPAWCRLTGHRLLEAQHPRYLIEARSEP